MNNSTTTPSPPATAVLPHNSTPPPAQQHDHRLTNWELNVIQDYEAMNNLNLNYEVERVEQKLWGGFQEAATSIAQLYVDRSSNNCTSANPTPVQDNTFRLAAFQATNLYKDGLDSSHHLTELALREGYTRRTRELLNWAKKKRKFIRRDEFISFLTGKKVLKLGQQLSQQQQFLFGQQQARQQPQQLEDDDDSTAAAAALALATFRTAITTSQQQQQQSNLANVINGDFQPLARKRAAAAAAVAVASSDQVIDEEECVMDLSPPHFKKGRFS